MDDFKFDAIVIGAGHAGIEAGLALSRLNKKTLVLAISLESVGFMACNPSVGGTAKGHLVREIDALGGEMGIAADKTLIQLRMLNESKGFAVQSLRAQVDKYHYHRYMKSVLELAPNLFLRQGEAVSITKIPDGEFSSAKDNGNEFLTAQDKKCQGKDFQQAEYKKGKEFLPAEGKSGFSQTKARGGYIIKTRYLEYSADSVILCCGVYLKSKILVGGSIENRGPSGFTRAENFSDSLTQLGIELRRFKTGTPARLKKNSLDLSQLEIQAGEKQPYSFSVLSKQVRWNKSICYLGYTNQSTHKIIADNLASTPRKLGNTEGIGARYCPSIEDKIERFSRDRHQFFLEPEGEDTQEMYIQGISTSLPADVQLTMYRSINGFSNAEIMRDAYAIEYDCIDATMLLPTLMHKQHKGLFFAGQINGTSGYEEAAAQGLVAGINAARYLDGKEPVVFTRDNSYIGVMIDDLVTKGTDEPYRMMTSRAEYRLHLRQDNADLRLTKIGRTVGLVSDSRYRRYLKKVRKIAVLEALAGQKLTGGDLAGLSVQFAGLTLEQFIKRHDVDLGAVCALDILSDIPNDAIRDVYIRYRYEGYLRREEQDRKEQRRLNEMLLPLNVDYTKIHGLRTEAAQKLNKIKPHSIGQACRISGVNPADINVLIVKLKS